MLGAIKKTDYVLDNNDEFERLEQQVTQKHYSLEQELKHLRLEPSARLLDAGCGSGVLSKHLHQNHPKIRIDACDFSEIRIQQAKKLNPKTPNINYHACNLLDLPFEDNTFNVVVSRYVYEYLQDPVRVTKELRRVLKKGGTLYLIDLDGVFLNFWTANERFNFLLKELEASIDFDLFVGRKLPGFLHQAGLESVKWEVTVHGFNEREEVTKELRNNETRLLGAAEKFSKSFGSQELYEEFKQLYLEEMNKIEADGNVMYFNKFISWGMK